MHKLRTPVAFEDGGFVVVDLLLFIVALIVCGSLMFGSCFYAVLSFLSSFVIISRRKRELVALL